MVQQFFFFKKRGGALEFIYGEFSQTKYPDFSHPITKVGNGWEMMQAAQFSMALSGCEGQGKLAVICRARAYVWNLADLLSAPCTDTENRFQAIAAMVLITPAKFLAHKRMSALHSHGEKRGVTFRGH